MTPHTAGRLAVEDLWADEEQPRLMATHPKGHKFVVAISTLRGVGSARKRMRAEAMANAARLVAAWNAVEGLTLEQIERLGELLRTTSPGDGLRMVTRITRE